MNKSILSQMRLLYIEDDQFIREELSSILQEMCLELYIAVDGADGLEQFYQEKPDLIFTDILMPHMDGLSMIEKIREVDKDIPIIISSALSDTQYLLNAIHMGINHYLLKPLKLGELFESLENQARQVLLKEYFQTLGSELDIDEQTLVDKIDQLSKFRTEEINHHIQRVARYSELLALKSGLSSSEVQEIKLASVLYDIGKLAIPNKILNKSDKLKDHEFKIIQTHAELGYEMLRHSKHKLLNTASIIAHQHHEKFNGTGYPNALKGEDIHIYGRITAIADVFDALSHESSYHKAWPIDKIVDLFKDESSKHFDPELITIFNHHIDEFVDIKNEIHRGA